MHTSETVAATIKCGTVVFGEADLELAIAELVRVITLNEARALSFANITRLNALTTEQRLRVIEKLEAIGSNVVAKFIEICPSTTQ